jgi:hypothetical protein
LARYDEVIRNTLQSVLNISLTEAAAWNQGTLLVANGGLGVRLATQVALPAFLASVAGSSPFILQTLPPRLHDTAGMNDPVFSVAEDEWKTRSSIHPPQHAAKQKAWDTPLVNVAAARVLSAAPNQAGIARLIAAAAPHAGAFLNALPCSSVGTRLDDSSLCIAIALRLAATPARHSWSERSCFLGCRGRVENKIEHPSSAARRQTESMEHTTCECCCDESVVSRT